MEGLGNKQNFQLNYEYHNTTKERIELWFSKPKESNTQQHISIKSNIDPDMVTEHPFLNSIWYFNLKPDEELKVNIKYYGSGKDENYSETITSAEKEFFLRSTKLIPVNEKIKKEAESIVCNAETELEKARKLYEHIIKKYRYSTRFNERGVFHFLKRRKGDCGEFSALHCAYCRSLGIPAKILYGTWTLNKFSPHSWNEIYIDGQGWVPVDTSVGKLKPYYHPLLNISASIYYGVFQNKNKYFGNHEGKRFAFSIEPERELEPPYDGAKDVSDHAVRNYINNQEFAWGFESIDGRAPFLQPIYPRIYSKVKKTSYKLLFGDWKGKHLEPLKNLTYITKTTSFNIGFILTFISIINDYIIENEWLLNILPLIYSPLILLGTILSIIRKEGNAFIYILGVIFLLNFIGTLDT